MGTAGAPGGGGRFAMILYLRVRWLLPHTSAPDPSAVSLPAAQELAQSYLLKSRPTFLRARLPAQGLLDGLRHKIM